MLPVRTSTVRPGTTAVVAKVVAAQTHDEVATVHALHERPAVAAQLPLLLLGERVERDPAVVLGAAGLAVGGVAADAARLGRALGASDVAADGLPAFRRRDEGGAGGGAAVDAVLRGRRVLDDLVVVLLRHVAGDELEGLLEGDRLAAALGREVLLAGEGRLEEPFEAVGAVDVRTGRDERPGLGRLFVAAGAAHRLVGEAGCDFEVPNTRVFAVAPWVDG